MINLKFSINTYDSDGDVVTEGIFLHFEDTSIKVADDIKGWYAFVESLQGMNNEIAEAYYAQ